MSHAPTDAREPAADRLVLPALALWLLMVFGGVWNPWWMPSGDAEVFLVVARNLYHGEGLVFNGHPVAFVPPGWPLVLAGLYRVTDSYLWLKLVQIGGMTTFLLSSYFVLRRFVAARTAGLACGLAAVLWPLYPLTMWLHSDALFCGVTGLTAVCAARWGDAKPGRIAWVWLALVAIGCSLGVTVRWAALAQAVPLAALACGGGGNTAGRSPWWPHLAGRHWLGALIVFAATLGTFFALKATLRSDAEGAAMASRGSGGWPTLAAALPEEVRAPSLFVGGDNPAISPGRELFNRALSLPQWVSWTLFAPVRVLGALGPIGLGIDYAVGLLALGCLGLAAWRAMRDRRQYLWLGVLLYVVALCLNWPHVNNRYLVPVAPLLIAGVLVGLGEAISSPRRRAVRSSARGLRWAFVAAVLATNVGLWGVDVFMCRKDDAEDFYASWEAGIYPSLIDAGIFLDGVADLRDGQTACSERYDNLNERWEYKLSPRSILLMTGKATRSVPTPLAGAGVRKAQAWARGAGVRYYVQQNPTIPGRFWHFRVSAGLHERLTGDRVRYEGPQFEIYEMRRDPIPSNPTLRSLKYRAVPPVRGEALERATRRVPHV